MVGDATAGESVEGQRKIGVAVLGALNEGVSESKPRTAELLLNSDMREPARMQPTQAVPDRTSRTIDRGGATEAGG